MRSVNWKGGKPMSRRALGLFAVFLLFSFLLSGCYYFSAKDGMKSAGSRVSELKGMDGARGVPYEYTSAEKFLEISNMEYDENDYKAAKEFSDRSNAAAQAGLSELKKAKK